MSEMTPQELLSEVWQKLIGAVSVNGEGALDFTPPDPENWSIDPHTPERDGRVVWLIEEIGGAEALRHRFEDILRERHGRAQPGRGRPIVQLGPDHEIEIDPEPGECKLQQADARRVWSGLLLTADLEFPPGDDVSMLLRLMAECCSG